MSPVRRTRLAVLAALAVTAFALLAAAGASAVNLPPGFQDEVVLRADGPGIEQPTTFKFAPDGRTFVALKGGKIVVYPPGANASTVPTVFADLAKQTYDNGDHGLLGLALDPRFDEGRPYVYALYTFNHELGAPASEMPKWAGSEPENDPCPTDGKCVVSGRLVRLTAEGDVARQVGGEAEETVLLEDWCQQFSSHSIGDLAFGPEGALFVSGGEGASFTNTDYGQYENLCGDPNGTKGKNMVLNPGAEGGSVRSQSPLRPNGQVLLNGTLDRIDPDTGEGWPGNPYSSSANANKRRIVAFGFRNPFRFTLNPRLDEVFVNNVGNGTDEEIDRIPIGSPIYNSGWPCYEGLLPNSQFEQLNLNACNRLYEAPGSTAAPFFFYTHSSGVAPNEDLSKCPAFNGSAISGSAFYEGATYPSEYDDALFFADSVRGCIYVMLADATGSPDPSSVRPFLSEGAQYPGVDLEQAPDGTIYYDNLYEGTIDRISYDPGAPVAKLKTVGNPWGPVGTTFEFDASESTAAAGHKLSYEWSSEGSSGTFKAGEARRTYKFGEAKNFTVAVRVKDQTSGKVSVAQVTVYPGDSPPQVSISKPVASLTWGVGQQIAFAGSAKDGGGTTLPAEDLYWKVRLLHCPFDSASCHEHPLQNFRGVKEGTIGAPDHDFPSYLHFFLTATDERGLSNQVDVKIAARPVSLQFRSEPSGVGIVAGTQTITTPGELQAIEDSPTTVIAPETITFEGVQCTFERWSDGKPRVHEVPTGASGTYTAFYSGPAGPGTCHKSAAVSSGGGEGAQPPAVGPPAPPSTLARPKLKSRPKKQTSSTTAKFAFSGPTGATFRCKLDGRPFATCRSPRIYRRLKPGRHTVRIYALNTATRSAATVFRWKIVAPRRAR